MNRRSFLERSAAGVAAGFVPLISSVNQTKHVILVVPAGARKKDYYENASLAPNIGQLASEGFVFTEDHCETVTSHRSCFDEMIAGLSGCVCVNDAARVSDVMKEFRPRVLVVRDVHHDAGHKAQDGYDQYLEAVRETDRNVGQIASWVKRNPEFKDRTAIIIRPEFGRDDMVNRFGELHHSPGFYYTHRVACIFWGPDFKRGVEGKRVVCRRDLPARISRVLVGELRDGDRSLVFQRSVSVPQFTW
jgi:hypothetical protein